MTSRLSKGCPRQLAMLWQNIRGSILFPWLVGGTWLPLPRRPLSSAKPCNARFHRRVLVLPPLSAFISHAVACGYLAAPLLEPPGTHHRPRTGRRVLVDAALTQPTWAYRS
jgi:hypothetical protein